MRVGMVSTFPPRRGGLASYAGELARALALELDVVVCAVDRHGLNYPDDVIAAISEDDPQDYRRAGRIFAEHAVDAVLIQQDDGVFGGPGGSHVLDLAQELRLRAIPYLVFLHSVPRRAEALARTVATLTADAAAVAVLTEDSGRVAAARRLAPADRLAVVPTSMRWPEVAHTVGALVHDATRPRFARGVAGSAIACPVARRR